MAVFEQQLLPYIEAEQEQYELNDGYSRGADFAGAREQYEIDDKLMMFTSFFGRGMICNPFALFQYCESNERFAEYRFVWTLDDLEKHKTELESYHDNKRVIFVCLHSKEYYRYLSTAKYLINNVTEPSYFVKKEGQVVINTWHGIPLKNLGYDVPNGAFESPNSIRNFLMSDFILSPNEYMTQKYLNAYKLHDIYDGKIIETGYPRCDTLFHVDRDSFIKKAGSYGVKIDSAKKVILYAPTWRGEKYASPDISMTDYQVFLECLKDKVNLEEYQILFKPHQIVYKNLQEQGLTDDAMIPAVIDANELLGITDILISDYSSIFFDFLTTGRPILFYVSDLEEYKMQRGLYFSVDELPGPVSDKKEIVADWLKELTYGEVQYNELFDYGKYNKAVEKFVPNEDGHVCERIIKAVFDNDNTHVVSFQTEKTRLLFHMDVLEHSSITTSFLKLLNSIDYDKYDVTLNAILPKGGERILFSVNENVRILCGLGRPYGTVRDTAARNYCMDNCIVENDNKDFFPANAYDTEFKRRFGYCKYDCIINFSGIDGYWANVLCSQKNVKQILWVHNDLKSELEKRVVDNTCIFEKNLPQIFKHFKDVDKIVCCSEATMEVNRKKLSEDDTYGKFAWVNSMVDGDVVLKKVKMGELITIDNREWYVDIYDEATEKAEVDAILIPCPQRGNINFVSVGRLSPEKNHEGLIRAFKQLAEENEAVSLYIMGDGPLKSYLRKLIKSLKLDGRVILTGNVKNPFPVEKMCQCFVMTSFYEGLPIALLEAKILGLPVIVSEFETVKDCLTEEGQMLIKPDGSSIYEGLKAFAGGTGPNKAAFDWETYNLKCICKFDKVMEDVLHM